MIAEVQIHYEDRPHVKDHARLSPMRRQLAILHPQVQHWTCRSSVELIEVYLLFTQTANFVLKGNGFIVRKAGSRSIEEVVLLRYP